MRTVVCSNTSGSPGVLKTLDVIPGNDPACPYPRGIEDERGDEPSKDFLQCAARQKGKSREDEHDALALYGDSVSTGTRCAASKQVGCGQGRPEQHPLND